MHPILFEWFHMKVSAYGAMVSLGFMAGLITSVLLGLRLKLSSVFLFFLGVGTFFSGLLGARILYVLVHLDQYRAEPLEIVMVHHGGLVLYGGLLFALPFAWVAARRSKGPGFKTLTDLLFPGLLLGIAIGRVGCFLVGDCYGIPASDALPWAVSFPYKEGSQIPFELLYTPLHPVQLYLSINAALLFAVTLAIFMRRRNAGQVFAWGLLFYAVTRGFLERFRGDGMERGFLGPLSTSQWVSLALGTAALLFIVARRPAKGIK